MNLGQIVTSGLLKKADATSPIPVASEAVIYTPSFQMSGLEGFEFLAATASGSIDVLAALEVGAAPPATEEATDTDWAEPDGLEDIINVKDTSVHVRQLVAPNAKYGRLKLTGQGSNSAGTTVQIRINRREFA